VSPRIRLIIISGLVSAVLGGAAAWALSQARQSQREQKTADATLPANHLTFEPSPAEYVQIAVAVVMLVKQIANLFRPDKG
jgi:hypothetical protein